MLRLGGDDTDDFDDLIPSASDSQADASQLDEVLAELFGE